MPQAQQQPGPTGAAAAPTEKPPIPQAALPKGNDAPAPEIAEGMYPVGIPGVELTGAERKVPEGEAPPLAINSQLKVIGKDVPRVDGRAKVTGAAKYTADVNLPGMLFARMLCSPHPHAKIKRIDSEVAGDPDILLAPDLEAGNILAKLLSFLANADSAGLVLGAKVPVILTSRADSVRSRIASCAVAMLAAHARRQGTTGKGH